MNLKKFIFPSIYLLLFGLLVVCIANRDENGDSCAIVDSISDNKKVINSELDEQMNLDRYIIDVINRGTNRLNHKAGEMLGGYAQPIDAPDVAEYVLYLMGHKKEINRNGRTIYEGNCAGCHGQNGDGIDGAFPRLDSKKLMGLKD